MCLLQNLHVGCNHQSLHHYVSNATVALYSSILEESSQSPIANVAGNQHVSVVRTYFTYVP